MTEIKIEKNVPVPDSSGRGAPKKYPYADMEVGDSFYIEDYKKARSCENSFRTYIKMNQLGWKLKTRKENTGLRIWRIE